MSQVLFRNQPTHKLHPVYGLAGHQPWMELTQLVGKVLTMCCLRLTV